MKDATAIYLGRIIDKKYFRVFIYSSDGTQRLVGSWDEYQNHMGSGLWFATIEEAQKSKEDSLVEEKPKQKRTRKEKVKEEIGSVGVLGSIDVEDDIDPRKELGYEVNQDDEFLPK